MDHLTGRTGKQIDIYKNSNEIHVCIMQAASAIYVQEDLKEKLQGLKRHPVESYNSVIERLLSSPGDHNLRSDDSIKGLEDALDDIMHHLTLLKKGI